MLLVVGGQSKDTGKTSVAVGILRALADRGWVALKISQEPGAQLQLREETGAGGGDSARFLAAGARRAFWLRVPGGGLGEALPAIREILTLAPHALVESNSLLDFIAPDLYLMVLDAACGDFKPSARWHLDRAGAFVVIERGIHAPPREIPEEVWNARPRFFVRPPDYAAPALSAFVAAGMGE